MDGARVVHGICRRVRRHDVDEVPEHCLVATVHADGDGRLASVPSEAAFTDEDPDGDRICCIPVKNTSNGRRQGREAGGGL